MPHKHKRKRIGDDDTDFDLPPSQRARALPALSSKSKTPEASRKRSKGRSKDNDAPRAFRRLMAMAQGKKTRSGLDNGDGGKPIARDSTADIPRIRPGEDMRSFSTRVDSALPVSGLTTKTVVKDGKDEQGIKVFRTRKERKMHKLYEQWRAEERKILERKEDELEEAAQRELDNDAPGITSSSFSLDATPAPKKKSKKGRQKADEDPWLVLKRKRAEEKPSLHDVAQQPPQLNRNMSRQLKVRGAVVDVGGIPKSAGSLRRREELQSTRNDVLDAYRKFREHEQRKLTSS